MQVIPFEQNSIVVSGGTLQLHPGWGYFTGSSQGGLKAFSGGVKWASTPASIATVDNAGLVATHSPGVATITVTAGPFHGSTAVIVISAPLTSICVSPSPGSVLAGLILRFTATGGVGGGACSVDITQSVSWSSSNSALAIISDSFHTKGWVSTIWSASGGGQVTITATVGSVSGNATLNVITPTLVSVSVSPLDPSVPKGLTTQFIATGRYNNNLTQTLPFGSDAVSWSSSNTMVATVGSSTGLATAVGQGTSTIQATSGSKSGSTLLTVIPPVLASITVSPVNPSVGRFAHTPFIATGKYTDNSVHALPFGGDTVAWFSSNAAIATISSTGIAAPLAPGMTVIQATSGSFSDSTMLFVSQLYPSLKTAGVNISLNRSNSDAQFQQAALSFDLGIAGSLSRYLQFNPNMKFLIYDNTTNANRGDGKIYALEQYMKSIATSGVQADLFVENSFAHFSQNTTVLFVAGPTIDTAFGGFAGTDYFTDQESAFTFDGSRYNYVAPQLYGGGATKFAAAKNQMLYLGNDSKLSEIHIQLTTSQTGLSGVWQYSSGDGVWKPLPLPTSACTVLSPACPLIDGTKVGTSSLRQSGIIRFMPPVDWYRSTLDTLNGQHPYYFWLRYVATSTPSVAPVAKTIHKEAYITVLPSAQFLVPGWDPANDRNGDGFVDDAEFGTNCSACVNPNATARLRYYSRVPTFYFDPERWVTNVADTNYKNFSVQYETQLVTVPTNGAAYDGMFEDNCRLRDGSTGDTNLIGAYETVSGGGVSEFPPSSSDPNGGIAFTQAHLALDGAVGTSFKAQNKLLFGNNDTQYADNPNFQFQPVPLVSLTDDPNRVLGAYFAAGSHNGVWREGWMRVDTATSDTAFSASLPGEGDEQVWGTPQFNVVANWNYALQWIDAGQHFVAHILGNTSIPVDREGMFTLSHFLMINDNNLAYFAYSRDGSPPGGLVFGAERFNLGRPTDVVHVFATGAEPGTGHTFHIFARDYSNALVLEKPMPAIGSSLCLNTAAASCPTATTHPLPGSYYILNFDGTTSGPVTKVTLRNSEGVILVINPNP